MAKTGFDARRYLTKLNGRDYLEVKWQLLWLRTEHPDAVVRTELVEHGGDAAVFRADVTLPSGAAASGWGTETADGFGDYLEKAETRALGRALAALGFGTQFCEDFSVDIDGAHPVDAPVAPPEGRPGRGRGAASRPTDPQLKAIYAIGRDRRLTQAEVQGRCRSAHYRLPEELGRRRRRSSSMPCAPKRLGPSPLSLASADRPASRPVRPAARSDTDPRARRWYRSPAASR